MEHQEKEGLMVMNHDVKHPDSTFKSSLPLAYLHSAGRIEQEKQWNAGKKSWKRRLL